MHLLFSISLGMAVIIRKNKKQRLCKIGWGEGWGGGGGVQIRCIMGNVEVAYPPVKKTQKTKTVKPKSLCNNVNKWVFLSSLARVDGRMRGRGNKILGDCGFGGLGRG